MKHTIDTRGWTADAMTAFEAYYAIGAKRSLKTLAETDLDKDGNPRWSYHTLLDWSAKHDWKKRIEELAAADIEIHRQKILTERARLSKQRLRLIAQLQNFGSRVLEKLDEEDLSTDDAKTLVNVAIKAIEVGLKAERLELGESTDILSAIKPSKAPEEMTDAELAEYRMQLQRALEQA